MRIYGKKAALSILLFSALPLSATNPTGYGRVVKLNELFEQIEANASALKLNKQGEQMAGEALAAARSSRLPDIAGQLSLSYLGDVLLLNRDFGNGKNASMPHFGNNFALSAQQVVYSGGALSGAIELAKVKQQQATVTTEQSRQQLRFILLGYYLNLYELDNEFIVYQQNIALTQRLIDDVKARQWQGTALKNDVTRYELQLADFNLALTKVESQRSILNHQLCTTLGYDAQTHLLPDTTLVDRSFSAISEAEWQRLAASSSPALQLSTLGESEARQQLRIERAARLPKVALIAEDHFDGPITIEVPPINKNMNYWFVGVGVKYSLSSLFKSKNAIRLAERAVERSHEATVLASQQVNNGVQAACEGYRQSMVELQTHRKRVELAQENYRVIRNRYDNALALTTDMLDAANAKLSAELQESNARISLVYAYYKMKYAAGELRGEK